MEASRVIISKELKEKMSKGLSERERGRIYYKRLVEVANDGSLATAKNRNDVAKLIGILDKPYGKGYQWVSQKVRSGMLTETLLGFKDGKAENSYHLGSKKPNYGTKRRKLNRKPEGPEVIEKLWAPKTKEVKPVEEPVPEPTKEPEPVKEEKVEVAEVVAPEKEETGHIRITVKCGDVTIEAENVSNKTVIELITRLAERTAKQKEETSE